jgi:hypothetical protein
MILLFRDENIVCPAFARRSLLRGVAVVETGHALSLQRLWM